MNGGHGLQNGSAMCLLTNLNSACNITMVGFELGDTMLFDDRSIRCPERCHCPDAYPQCQDGVPVVMDGCGCCPVCARQQGDVCNTVQVCDVTRKLQCIYVDAFFTTGICRGININGFAHNRLVPPDPRKYTALSCGRSDLALQSIWTAFRGQHMIDDAWDSKKNPFFITSHNTMEIRLAFVAGK
ncbi:protein CYR61 [Trichonephila clavipes]|nr:protein CYR61 [Trichonephila clavipes]